MNQSTNAIDCHFFMITDFSSVRKLISPSSDAKGSRSSPSNESKESIIYPLPPTSSRLNNRGAYLFHRTATSSSGHGSNPAAVLPTDLCPSCLMPFDKNRKRRLIDSCGHERCYSCLFSSEICPLCSPAGRSSFLHRDPCPSFIAFCSSRCFDDTDSTVEWSV